MGTREQEILEDIKKNPTKHRGHDFNNLLRCCTVEEGATSARLMQAHEDISLRTNGGVRCDVKSGPCSCGAWH